MPIEEGTPGSTPNQNTGTPNNNSTPNAGSVSDLGDLLIDKSLDNIQNKDYVPVSKNDIENLLGDNATPVSTTPTAEVAPTESAVSTPSTSDAITSTADLHDIFSETTTPASTENIFSQEKPVENTTTPESTVTSPIDLTNELQDIALPENDTAVSTTSPAASTETTTTPEVAPTTTGFDPLNILGTPGSQDSTSTPATNTDLNSIGVENTTPTQSTTDNNLTTTSAQVDSIPSTVPAEVSTPATDIPTVNTEPVSSDTGSIDLGDPFGGISLDSAQPDKTADANKQVAEVSSLETSQGSMLHPPVSEETSTDPILQEMANIDLGQGAETSVNASEPVSQPETPVVTDIPAVTAAPIEQQVSPEILEPNKELLSKTATDTLGDISMPEAQAAPIDTNPVVEQPTTETPPQSSDNTLPDPIVLDTKPADIPIVDMKAAEASISDALNNLQTNVTEQPVTPTAPVNTVESAEKAALETIANNVTQGIDIDSLLPDTNTTAATSSTPAASVNTPIPAADHPVTAGNDPHKQKKMLLILGAVAFLGLVFFAIQLMNGGSSTDMPVTPTETVATGEDSDILPGDTVVDTGSDTATGMDILPGDTQPIGTGNETGSGDIVEQPTVTQQGLIEDGKDLLQKTKKAMIKATVNKNSTLRTSAFQLQKDIEAFVQTLENTSDITNLEESENTLKDFSQRLDGILQKLDGSSSQ